LHWYFGRDKIENCGETARFGYLNFAAIHVKYENCGETAFKMEKT